ncbi:MAG: type II toxin-antitoxin system RelE/ParE family toxin [Gammaproteobacteria bacterium]|nr:type II toxin-antitoxin system RelE/ParE family toxin [Gammaproteobacteria bacterium]
MDGKELKWTGSSLKDLTAFPDSARREAGYQLHRVQFGMEPDDWKPFKTVGPGVREIRIKEAGGIYRVVYVAKFEEAIYVLHAFQKKTGKTALKDITVATVRYQAILAHRTRGKQDGHLH